METHWYAIKYLQANKHKKEVGFVIDKAVMIQVKIFVPVSEHICYIGISHQELDLIILHCYALTDNVDDKKKMGSMIH